jgi:hypothetical protein
MNEGRWLQVGGAGGIVFVVLQLGFSLVGASGEPSFDAPAKDWLTSYRNSHDLFLAVPYAAGLPMLGFLLFVCALHVKLRVASNGERVPSIAVLLFGGVAAAMLLASIGSGASALLRVGHGLDESGASTLSSLANEFFVMSWFAIGGLLLAAGLGAISSHTLPTWLGWSGAVIGLGSVIAVAGQLTAFWLIPFWLFYIWVVAMGMVLIRGARSAPMPT